MGAGRIKMIKLMRSTFYKEDEMKDKLVSFIKKASQLSMGDQCNEFEKRFSKHQQRKYSVFFNSGSSANLALILSLLQIKKLKKGDKVGFSSITWATNVMPLIQFDLQPIPIDISLNHLNITSENFLGVLEKEDLKALFVTNLLGFSGDIIQIQKICKEKGVLLLEDNCESLGSKVNNIKLGNFGLASTFSFFVGHHLSTIEGGMVCTDDEELYNILKMVRSHGWDRNLNKNEQNRLRNKNKINDFYTIYAFYVTAFNLRPTEINGYIGIEQLEYAEEIYKKRNDNFKMFSLASKNNSDMIALNLLHMEFVSNFSYPIILKTKELTEIYKRKFRESDVEIRPIVGGNIIEQPFFKDYMESNGANFVCKNAQIVGENGFYIPNNPELTKSELDLMCKILQG